MRIFIAIDLPERIKDEIEKIRKGLRGIYGKPVEKENFHITLKFIGDVQPDIFEKIKEELNNVKYNKFSIKIGNIGTFGDRVVWIGIQEGYEDIVNLHNLIDEQLYKIKIDRDYKFSPHITIYRIKEIINKKEFKESVEKLSKYISDDILIDKFYIKQSILRPQGPLYINMAEYKLL